MNYKCTGRVVGIKNGIVTWKDYKTGEVLQDRIKDLEKLY
jgi:hypothetical protein